MWFYPGSLCLGWPMGMGRPCSPVEAAPSPGAADLRRRIGDVPGRGEELLGDIPRGPRHAGVAKDRAVSSSRAESGLQPEGLQGRLCGGRAAAQETWAQGQQREAGGGPLAQHCWVVWGQMGPLQIAWSPVRVLLCGRRQVPSLSQTQTSAL